MSASHKVVYKNGEWLIENDELRKLLEESASDSEDEADPCVLHETESESSSVENDNIDNMCEAVEIEQMVEADKPKNVWYSGIFAEKLLPIDDLPHQPITVKSAYEYFQSYFNEQHFVNAATYSNMYYLSTKGAELKTTAHELKKLYGVFMLMGCISFPRLDLYWRKGFRIELVSNAVSKTRFKKLWSALHFVDANQTPDPTNVFWKIQPVIDAVRNRCRALPRVAGSYSVDEQMVPYTGRCPARQYVKNKPQPVGLKSFVITTSSGMIMDFELYQGIKTNLGNRSLGLGPAVVLRLVNTIPKGSFIYFDRYFTTISLLFELLQLGYRATGTVMNNRLKNPKFKADRNMERGECQELLYSDGRDELTCVKWKDTKCVTALSTIAGIYPTTTVTTKSRQIVSCPKIISSYNSHMGGVDIVDQMMEYYRTFIKTKKWTLKTIHHLIDLGVVNAWMEYRQDCLACGVPKNRRMDLLDFKLEIGGSLISNVNRNRRDSSSEDEILCTVPPNLCSPLPSSGKRFDGYDHWPVFDPLKFAKHCRLESCKSRTRCRCEKCKVYLCLVAERNCFKRLHDVKK